MLFQLHILTDTVENNNRGIDGITHNSQHTRDKGGTYGPLEYRIECDNYKHVMHKSQNCAGRKRDVAETEPDVKQHTDCGNHYGDDGILLHLVADCTGNAVRRDLLLIYTKVVDHSLIKRFSLFHAQGSRLDDDLIRSRYLLCLGSRFTRDLLHDRDNLG